MSSQTGPSMAIGTSAMHATIRQCRPYLSATNCSGRLGTSALPDTRSPDPALRRQYVGLVQDCRQAGADVRLFSSMHVSGEQLGLLSGVAANLRYPMPEIEDLVVEDAAPPDAAAVQ
eukprot:m.20910 g.20910  ORF g.20910 m.20910 type:complete len:117 (+) comp3572_c0_seq1:849-1199(+)